MVKDLTGLAAAGAGLMLLAGPDVFAHPAHTKPVNHPFVVGFERFHGPLDDEDYLAEGGFLLLNELNCVACHAPSEALAADFPGVVATSLEGVGSRLRPVELELFVRNPRFAKRDTTMPSLFAGPDRDLNEVAALRAWLGSLVEEVPVHPLGEIESGRALYHRIGCVACHAPEPGYRPPGLPEEADIDLVGLPSVPMNLADHYGYGALVEFLLDPLRHRPSGRMPDFGLSPGEARDLAAYLKAGPDLVLPDDLVAALDLPAEEPDPALLAEGRRLFATKSCHACHAAPGEDAKALAAPAARPLSDLDPAAAGGCLSERPQGGPVPFYGLAEAQRSALVAALRRLPVRQPADPATALSSGMKRLNCHACHELGGVGGPEFAREPYFGTLLDADKGAETTERLPPVLDGVSGRIGNEGLRRILLDPGTAPKSRPGLATRMPRYPEALLAPLLRGLGSAGQEDPGAP